MAARNIRISSTELPVILGISKFATPLDLWLIKKGLKERAFDNSYMRLGRRLEYGIFVEVKEELEKNRNKILPIDYNDKIVYAPHVLFTKDIFSCHIDAAVLYPNDEIKYIIEIKSTSMPISVFEKYALPQYECQVMQQIYITGAQRAIIAVAPDGGSGELKYYYVFFDEEKWQQWEAEARRFYMSLLHDDTPPEWVIQRSKEVNKEMVSISDVFSSIEVSDEVVGDVVAAILGLNKLKEEKRKLERQIKAIEGILSNAIKGNGEIKYGDYIIAKATTYEVEALDKNKLKEEQPEIYEKYLTKQTRSRLTIANTKALQSLSRELGLQETEMPSLEEAPSLLKKAIGGGEDNNEENKEEEETKN